MEITHTWKVRKLIQRNDDSGTVIQVFYKVHSTNGERYYVSPGGVELDTENITNFVSYENLTEELVVSWIKNKLGSDLGGHEKLNIEKINSFKNVIASDIKVRNLPWQIQEVTVSDGNQTQDTLIDTNNTDPDIPTQ